MKKIFCLALMLGLFLLTRGYAMDQETFIREHMSTIAATMFPDNANLQWEIISIKPHAAGYDVTAKSTNGDVGYNPVRLIIKFNGETNAKAAACYIPEGKGWTLLADDGSSYEQNIK